MTFNIAGLHGTVSRRRWECKDGHESVVDQVTLRFDRWPQSIVSACCIGHCRSNPRHGGPCYVLFLNSPDACLHHLQRCPTVHSSSYDPYGLSIVKSCIASERRKPLTVLVPAVVSRE